ncbi:MAG: sulfotransferase, partial [Gammaproteobacteria bacterium]
MSLIFVGGSQRSGTTVLQQLLCADQDASPRLAEASYLRMLVSTYQQARLDFDHDTSSYFRDLEQFRNFHASVVNIFLNRTLNAHYPARHLVLKEPHLTPLFPALFDLVPNAQFVLIF